MKSEWFRPMKERLVKRMTMWPDKKNVYGRQESFNQVGGSRYPNIWNGCFYLTASNREECMKLVQYFWWGRRLVKKFHVLSRKFLTKPCSLTVFVPRCLKLSIYPNGELFDTVFASEISLAWRGVQHGRQQLNRALIWRIQSGSKIHGETIGYQGEVQ